MHQFATYVFVSILGGVGAYAGWHLDLLIKRFINK